MILRAWLVLVLLTGAAHADRPITLDVDAREMPRRLLHAHLTIPAKPGKLLLKYPKWIPGEHGPSGPIDHVSKMVFTAGGKPLRWTRDPVELFNFTVDVPQGVSEIAVDLDMVLPSSGEFSGGGSATARVGLLSWNHVLLYPDGKSSDDLRYKASVTFPKGWKVVSPLAGKASGDRTVFEETSLTTLVDSPVQAGVYVRQYELANSPRVVLSVAADSDEATVVPDAALASYKKLVTEAGALFGVHHYHAYTFLLTLSDNVAHFGLEHHESSDDRLGERMFLDEDKRSGVGLLLAHEYVHSWNGKYRRPAGLQPGHFDLPMNDELLWVYEGLTEYLGLVIAARAGVDTPEFFRAQFATNAASLEGGRSWRPLVDTAVDASQLYGNPSGWVGRTRSVDYYPEGALFWVEVDAIIRAKTNNAKSLDDFCHAFHGGKDGSVDVAPYTLDDVIAGLDKVVTYDWRGLIKKRVYDVRAKTPVEGLEAAGWNLTWVTKPTGPINRYEKENEEVVEDWSVGFSVDKDNALTDVLVGSPADRAGLIPGMKLIAINARTYSTERLRAAVATKKPFDVIAQQGDTFITAKLDTKTGPRFPDLAKAKTTDYLTPIFSAKSKP
jgi:predicted metalloprotease with PDZ domain